MAVAGIMRTVAIIQARLGSTRFPRKVLADLNGKPMLQHVYERACQIPRVDDVFVVVPWSELEKFSRRKAVLDIPILAFKGVPEGDVLERYRRAARAYRADLVMRITADCPALNPVVAGQVLDLFYASQPCDFASNDTLVSGYPDGWDVEVFSREALEGAAWQATDPSDREHVTPWMKRHLRCVTLMAPEPWMGPKKLSVDTEADLETVGAWLAR